MNNKSFLDDKKALYVKAKDAYYNSDKEIMSDYRFDVLEDAIRAADPKWPELKKTGVLGKKKPVTLRVPMPSLSKCKSHGNVASKFMSRVNRFDKDAAKVAMEKLDGGSVLATYEGGKLVSLATRGDGITGQDITFLAPYCRTLPSKVSRKAVMHIRMEAVLTKEDFQTLYANKAVSARAAVSGALNRTEASGMLRRIHFVALRLLDADIPVGAGLDMLSTLGFITVKAALITKCTDDDLTTRLVTWRSQSLYEIDGLVIHANNAPLPVDDTRPKFAFAYKLDEAIDTAPLATIKEIVWKKSAFNVLVPKAIITPIDFDGVTVKQVALHNYAWAVANQTGIGAIVRVIRSGDIIPKIVKVEKPMPISLPTGFGKVTFDGTNVLCVDITNNKKELLERQEALVMEQSRLVQQALRGQQQQAQLPAPSDTPF